MRSHWVHQIVAGRWLRCLSGREIDTENSGVLPQWNINVVMPVGGQSSVDSDRPTASRALGPIPLCRFVFGLSKYFGARYARRTVAGAAGRGRIRYRRDGGPPSDPRWLRNDLFRSAPLLCEYGTRLWIASGNWADRPVRCHRRTARRLQLRHCDSAGADAFQFRLGPTNAVFRFPAFGVHARRYWADQVLEMAADLSAHLGCGFGLASAPNLCPKLPLRHDISGRTR